MKALTLHVLFPKNLSSKYLKNKGYLRPIDYKTLSNQSASHILSFSQDYFLPILSSKGEAETIIIHKGDYVTQGQPLTGEPLNQESVPIHSPCNGQVIDILYYYCGHASGLSEKVIHIQYIEFSSIHSPSFLYHDAWKKQSSFEQLKMIHDAGIVGLGGSAYPAHCKQKYNIKTLIINAMECDPYITCDDRLLQEQTLSIFLGALIVAKITEADHLIFAIEDNKPHAIHALKRIFNDKNAWIQEQLVSISKKTIIFSLFVAPSLYPNGSERQLIQQITGETLKSNEYPFQKQCLVHNIATLWAISQAIIYHKPLTKRLITITGNAVPIPGNYWIVFGTPIHHIMKTLNIDPLFIEHVIYGGEMMGERITDYSVPIQKKMNALIFNIKKEPLLIDECIRCAECVDVCPEGLHPHMLYWHSRSDAWEKLLQYDLHRCIECGSCDYVCPSNIPLVTYFKYSKSQIHDHQKKKIQSQQAKKRFEQRSKRLEFIKKQNEKKHLKDTLNDSLKTQLLNKKKAIQAALLRVKKKPKRPE
jgi:electron transport complex protein RnfC